MAKAPWTVEVFRTLERPERWLEVKRLARHALVVDGDAIGFLAWEVYDYHHSGGRILVCFANGDLVGFLMWRFNRDRELRILQVWVRPDARMILHGRALIDRLLLEARRRSLWIVRLWCAEDLAANVFWKAMGFQQQNWRFGSGGRRHLLWTLSVGGISDGRSTFALAGDQGLREAREDSAAARCRGPYQRGR